MEVMKLKRFGMKWWFGGIKKKSESGFVRLLDFWIYFSKSSNPLIGRISIQTSQIGGLFYKAPAIISSTTDGSSNVDVSPKLPISPSATFLRILRIILPERVFGKPVTN